MTCRQTSLVLISTWLTLSLTVLGCADRDPNLNVDSNGAPVVSTPPQSADIVDSTTGEPRTTDVPTELDLSHEDVTVDLDDVLGDDLLGDDVLGDDVLGDDVLGDDVPGDASQAQASPVSSTQASMPSNARELLQIRAHHDKTTWKHEVEAQRYERTFVALWDKLIFGDDKYAVLREFPFGELRLRRSLQHTPSDWGIQISRFVGADRIVTASQWPEFLDQFREQGYEIVETEWHHQKFETASADVQARSLVSTLMHVNHPPTQRRFIIKGDLSIVWATKPRTERSPNSKQTRYIAARPASIDARDIQIIWRKGEPAFKPQLVKEFVRDSSGRTAPSTIHPLILHDLNNDGLPEVIVGGYNQVFWNEGNFNFRAAELCHHEPLHTNAAIIADFTGDGVDDYLCGVKNGFPLLYQGQPGGKFPDPPREMRIANEKLRTPTSMTAGDIDGDAELDLFIGQPKPSYMNGDIPTPYYDANDSFPSFLLVNDGTGNFRNVIDEVGLGKKSRRRNFSASFVDLDNDGDLDLFMASDFSGADLFLNDGHGRFTDATDRLRPRGAAFGMSHTFGDYDLDGQLDFLIIGMSSTTARRLEHLNLGREGFEDYNAARMMMGYGNRMYLARGDSFVQAPFNESVARTGWSWGSTTLDFDRDGDQDVYVGNGQTSGKTTQDYCTRFWCHDVYYKRNQRPDLAIQELFSKMEPLFSGHGVSWNGYEHNALLMNLAGDGYLNIGHLMGVAFEFDTRCVVSGDLDGDGAIDLLVEQKDLRNSKSLIHIARNQGHDQNHWIGVHLLQGDRGPSTLGARVTVHLQDGTVLLQHNVSGHSVWAQHANSVHFGIGQRNQVKTLSVRWPDGTTTQITDPAINQYHLMRSLPRHVQTSRHDGS